MKRLDRVHFCMSVIVLFLIAPFALTASGQNAAPELAQNVSPAPSPNAKRVKQRFSDKASGQNLPYAPACGPAKLRYRVKVNDNPGPNAPPRPGKALIYFIQDENTDGLIDHTTRIALDGKWIGANKGTSYFSVSVDPGVHHVCASTETMQQGQPIELAHFTAEAGQTYYYRTKLILTRYVSSFDLAPLDGDEGSYLADFFPLSESKPKK